MTKLLDLMKSDPLPTEAQRIKLHDLVATAFIEIRILGWAGRATQAAELANAFHNLPREIYGWGIWNVRMTRRTFQRYQDKYHGKAYVGKTDYVAKFDTILNEQPE